MVGTPHISVIVCTRSRSASLERMLSSMANLKDPRIDWELIIVDSGSTDDTRDVIKSRADALPIRVVSEPQPGLSNARNRGVAHARGDYVCWTDDDVLVDPGWLCAWRDAFEATPDGVYFGGRVVPVFEGEKPKWLVQNMNILGPPSAERNLGSTLRAFRREFNES